MKKLKRIALAFSLVFASCISLCAQEPVVDAPDSAKRDADHYLYASVGYSGIVSKLDCDWASGNPHSAFNWQAGYEWLFSKNVGIGFLYDGTTCGGDLVRKNSNKKAYFSVNYFGLQCVLRFRRPDSPWGFSGRIGFGLCAVVDSKKINGRKSDKQTTYGEGFNLGVNAEYGLSRNLSLYCGPTIFVATLPDETYSQRTMTSGIFRLSLNVGLICNF